LTSTYYDAVVMGMELGPLTAGALLARRGFRVLVVGQGGACERYPCFGYTFTRRPFLITAPASPAIRRVLDELSIGQLFQKISSVPAPCYQVVTPEARVDVYAEHARTAAEIARELRTNDADIREALQGLGRMSVEIDRLISSDLVIPPESFFERREFARAQVQNPFFGERVAAPFVEPDSDLGRLLEIPVRLETAGARRLTPLVRARLAGAWLLGCQALEGGRDSLRRLLSERVVGQGGDVQPGRSVREIVISRGKVTGVRLSGKEEPTSCQMVLTDLSPGALAPSVAPTAWTKRFRCLVEEAKAPLLGYCLNLGVDPGVVPAAMADTVLVSSGPGLGEQLLRVERVPQGSESVAALNVSCVVPPGEERSIGSGVLRDAILDRMRWLIPFLDNHLHVIHSPYDGFGPQNLTGEAAGEAPPVPHPEEVPLWLMRRPDDSGPLGFEALSHRTGIKGLFLSGNQVVNGLGTEGEFIAAWGAARICAGMDPTKRRLVMSMRSKVEI